MEQSLEAGKRAKSRPNGTLGTIGIGPQILFTPALILFQLGGRGADYTQPTFRQFRRGKGQRGKE